LIEAVIFGASQQLSLRQHCWSVPKTHRLCWWSVLGHLGSAAELSQDTLVVLTYGFTM